jgi:hypothetical protein
MTNYATADQLANFIAGNELDAVTPPAAPSDAGVLLRQASSLVRQAIRGALYAVDSDGIPTDATLALALAEATCAQAAAWSTNGVNPTAGRAGATAAVASKSLGGATVQYASYAADAQARSDLASGDVLISEALRVLDAAGFLTNIALSPGVNVRTLRETLEP